MKRVLILNNKSRQMLDIMKRIKGAGHEVHVIENEHIGFDYYASQTFDVVIMGVLPPELEGLKTIIRFKNEYPSANIFAIEDYREEERYESYHPLKSAKMFGAARTFTTPVENHQLLSAIDRLANREQQSFRRKQRHLSFCRRSNS